MQVAYLGRRPYGAVLALQRQLCRERVEGIRDRDLLLLVEHDPVITLGRGTKPGSLPVPQAQLLARGFTVEEVERGGDVTLHAPGQLVGYPILDLAGHRKDLHWYLRMLEETLIVALDALGIAGGRREALTGVWVGERKIASIGVHVKQWVTLHGFALNITTNLNLFDLIVPCGIAGVQMTSVVRELASPPADLFDAARGAVTQAFGEVFHRPLEAIAVP